jgi:hypothetical protein
MKFSMITMWMREQDRVEMIDALPDQKRHDNVLADGFRYRRAVARFAVATGA